MVQTRRTKQLQQQQDHQGGDFQRYRDPNALFSSSSEDEDDEDDVGDLVDEGDRVLGKEERARNRLPSSSSSESSSEENQEQGSGLSKAAFVSLLKAIEKGGGPDNHTKENHKLSAICNSDKQLFGNPGTKKRRQVQNKLTYLKGLPISVHYELLTDNGIIPSTATLDKYKSPDHRETSRKKKKPTKASSKPVDKENVQNKKQTPDPASSSPSFRSARANTSNKTVPTASSSVKILSPPKPVRLSSTKMPTSKEFENWPTELVGHPYGTQHVALTTVCYSCLNLSFLPCCY